MKYVLGLLLIFSAVRVNAQQRLTVSPLSGKAMEIRYDTAGSPFLPVGNGTWLAIVTYQSKNATLKTDTILLKPAKAKRTFTGLLQPPVDAVAFMIAVQKGEVTDDNYGNGFLFPVMEKGKALAYGWYALSRLKQGMYGLKKDQQQSLAFMKKEVENNPGAGKEFKQQFFNMLVNSPEPADKDMLIRLLLEDKDAGEMDLTMAQKYLTFLGQKQSTDSIAAILTQRYPNGIYIRETAMGAVQKETDWKNKQSLFQQFIHRFPEPATQPYEYLTLYKTMVTAAARAGDKDGITQYISLFKKEADKTGIYTQVAADLRKSNIEQARIYVDKALAGIDTSRNFNGLETYTLAASLYSGKDDVLAQRFRDIVAFHTAVPKKVVVSEQAIRAQLLDEQVAGISLKDVNGQTVDIGKLKGKIVVLDFWATWCKPCIASFPAMQKVMAQHPEVVFLYICTFEKNDVVKLVKNFTADHPFPFRYLIDEQTDSQAGYKAFNHYKVSSVPYKLIIDKSGRVRFRTNGFDGNEEELVSELNMMIRLLQ